MVKINDKLNSFLKLLRIWQWLKNLLIIVPIILSDTFDYEKLLSSIKLFFIFSLFVSGNYILNDLNDVNLDKNHPEKKYRPIASGDISKFQGKILSLFLFISTSIAAYLNYGVEVVFLFLIYLCIAVLYTKFLKFINFIDSFVISTLFLVRLVIGGVSSAVSITIYLYSFTFFISMFIVYLKKNSIINKEIINNNLFQQTLIEQNIKFSFLKILYFLGILVNTCLVLWGVSLWDNFSINNLSSLIGFVLLFLIISFKLIKKSSKGDLEDFVIGIFNDKIILLLLSFASILFSYFYF